jgi:hypothetical protein
MAEFPVPLDNLIAYVKALHPDGGPLDNVADAFTVSAQLDEQSDALIGFFVDQARKSGASWSQIGAAMGVTKQAAQKRFVPGKAGDLDPTGGEPFNRFTDRARHVVEAAGRLAGQGREIDAVHLAAALLSEPGGVAAKAIAAAGLTPEQVCAALGTGPVSRGPLVELNALRELTFAEPANVALKGALKAALRLGHNYIGTEHLLLGLLFAGDAVTEAFGGLGLTPQRAQVLISDQLAAFRSASKAD